MKDILILYRSKAGFAQGYAELFNKHLDSDIEVFKKYKEEYSNYKEIYYLGGIYIGGINGFKKFKQHIKEDQIIHVIPVGASPGKQSDLDAINKANFTEDEMKRFKIKYMRGGFDISKCGPIDTLLMTLMKWTLKRKKNPTADQRGMLESYKHPVNFVHEQKVLDYLKQIN